jgi:hypothetical protein
MSVRVPLLFSASVFCMLVACGQNETLEEDVVDENEVVSSLQGLFQTDAADTARFRPGYLYRIDISKANAGKRYGTIYIVTDECGQQSPDGSCDRKWVDTHAKSLDRRWNDLKVSTRKKTIAISYEVEDASGEYVEKTHSWSYRAVPNGLTLTATNPGARPFDVKRLPPKKVDDSVKAAFTQWMEQDVENDTSVIDEAPSVRIEDLPLEAQRSVHFYDVEWPDYGTDARKITVAGKKYYSLSQQNDGGGKYIFFTLDGVELGEFGGSESGEWGFSWDER